MGNTLEYYICKLPPKTSCLGLSKFDSILTGAFKYAPVENILLNQIIPIEESTFENCSNLRFVAWADISKIENKNLICIESDSKKEIKTIEPIEGDNDGAIEIDKIGDKKLVIRKNAFKGCDNLETVILPSNKCIIEKDAFAYCKSLRTVIYPGDDISFIDNPFVGCDNLTIVYKKNNSYLKAFINVHPYKSIEIN